ncbi:MAG: hypothetical protein ABJA49_16400 [Betaproteobacteria bacterium]
MVCGRPGPRGRSLPRQPDATLRAHGPVAQHGHTPAETVRGGAESWPGLDVSAQARIVALPEELRRDAGLTLIFISHDLSLGRSLCDHVLILRQGEVVEQGDGCRDVVRVGDVSDSRRRDL